MCQSKSSCTVQENQQNITAISFERHNSVADTDAAAKNTLSDRFDKFKNLLL